MIISLTALTRTGTVPVGTGSLAHRWLTPPHRHVHSHAAVAVQSLRVGVVAWKHLSFLTARFGDRVFGFVNFYKSMLGIFVWLGLTGILGAINGIARILILLRRLIR